MLEETYPEVAGIVVNAVRVILWPRLFVVTLSNSTLVMLVSGVSLAVRCVVGEGEGVV
jgi:hypothetical protein